MITQEQSDEIKQHLLQQLTNFPEEKREQIKNQIMAMTLQDIENFVKQNQLDHLQQCIFCSIAKGETSSFKIDENQDNIAILEINPLSKGHALIIPKKHLEKPPTSAYELANQVAQKLNHHLNPKDIKVQENKIMNHAIVEIIPSYTDTEQIRKKAEEGELHQLRNLITQPEPLPAPIPQPPEVQEEKPEALPQVKPRIP